MMNYAESVAAVVADAAALAIVIVVFVVFSSCAVAAAAAVAAPIGNNVCLSNLQADVKRRRLLALKKQTFLDMQHHTQT